MYYFITKNIITPNQYGFMPSLNLKTTKYFILQPCQKINFNLLPLLILAGEILEKASNIKYIGIVIDHHLSWLDLIDYFCDKVSRSTKVMTKVKRYFGKHCLIIVYFSLMYSYLIYGCLLWGNNSDSPLSQLIRLQNKVVRITNDTPLRDPITPYYVNSGLPKCHDNINLLILLLGSWSQF